MKMTVQITGNASTVRATVRDSGPAQTVVKVLVKLVDSLPLVHTCFYLQGGCSSCPENSQCTNGFCSCDFGYYNINGTCVQGISDIDCSEMQETLMESYVSVCSCACVV